MASLSPDKIHPGLWRATQLALPERPATSTGHPCLDAELPGGGWPPGALIELMPSHDGIGELSLLRPALAQVAPSRSIFLLNPPYTPHFHCWMNWGFEGRTLLWLVPPSLPDLLWSAEQILRHDASAALLCWASPPRAAMLRRLHLAARQSQSLFFLLRPPAAAQQPSAAILRLLLQPAPQGIDVHILKRKGPACEHAVSLALYPSRPARSQPRHVTLDQPLPASSQSGRQLSILAH